MSSRASTEASTRPRAGRFLASLGASLAAHALLALALVFEVAGVGGGFGLGVGPGFGIGSGGGFGLGEQRRRQIFSIEDIPDLVQRPQDPPPDGEAKALLTAYTPRAVVVPQPPKPRPVASDARTGPVVQFARPARPIGAATDLGARFAAAGAGSGGLGFGGGGGGMGISLGSLSRSFGQYVGTLRRTGLDVALVVDASGSMQMIIDDLKARLGDFVGTMQRLVPTARIGAVVYRDREDGAVATAPRQSEDFVVKWTDLTFNTRKVQSFLGAIVAEGGGDWKEAVLDGVETAMTRLKWRPDAKKVLIVIGSSPPHDRDLPRLRALVADWNRRGGVVSTVDVSERLHEEHARKLHRWLYGEELREVGPLPAFYEEVRESFRDLARAGGGNHIALGQDQALMRHVLVLTFGPQWERDVTRIGARGRS